MAQTHHVLIVDDHPLIIKAYNSALQYLEKHNSALKFEVQTAADCDTADHAIKKARNKGGFDLVFLDISLPPSKDGKLISGEDIGVKLREQFDTVKIIVATTYNDNQRIHNILKTINPDGFLIKSDLTPEVLNEAITGVLSDPPYYSQPVLKLLRKLSTHDFVLDEIDRKLLYELSKGSKMKELPDVLLLSIAALERRKRILKELFNVSGKGDRDLIEMARDKGFI